MIRQAVSAFGLGYTGFGVACSGSAGGHELFGFGVDSVAARVYAHNAHHKIVDGKLGIVV